MERQFPPLMSCRLRGLNLMIAIPLLLFLLIRLIESRRQIHDNKCHCNSFASSSEYERYPCECEDGFQGPGCHYEHLNLHGTHSLFDGNMATCTDLENDFDGSKLVSYDKGYYYLLWLVIVMRGVSEIPRDIAIHSIDPVRSNVSTQIFQKSVSGTYTTLIVNAVYNPLMKTMSISGLHNENTCEMYVVIGRNLLQQTSNQRWHITRDYLGGERKVWWTLNFNSPVLISTVIFTLPENYLCSLYKCILLLSISNDRILFANRTEHLGENNQVSFHAENHQGPVKRIHLSLSYSNNRWTETFILQNSGLVLIGERICAPGMWGLECNRVCDHCADNQTCDVAFGSCPEDCALGISADHKTVMDKSVTRSWFVPRCEHCRNISLRERDHICKVSKRSCFLACQKGILLPTCKVDKKAKLELQNLSMQVSFTAWYKKYMLTIWYIFFGLIAVFMFCLLCCPVSEK